MINNEKNLIHLNNALIDEGNQQGSIYNNTQSENINLTEFNPNYLFF